MYFPKVSESNLLQAASPDSPELFQHSLEAWLDGQTPVLHVWANAPQSLADVPSVVEAIAHRQSAQAPAVHVFSPGDLLALLQRLNALMAGSVAPSASPGGVSQIWILQNAERMEVANLDVLRRICIHYPELGVRLVWLSHSPSAPVWPEGVQTLALHPGREAEKSEGLSLSPPQPKRWVGPAGWILLGALLAAAIFWGLQTIQPAGPAAPVSSPPSASASGPDALVLVPQRPAGAGQETKETQEISPASAAHAPSAVPGSDMGQATPERQPVSASRRWLLGLPEGTLVVVHADLATLQEAEKFRTSHALLANARILLARERQVGAERFLVVTGPFRSRERVGNYIQRLPWKNQAEGMARDELLRQVRP